MDAPTRSEHTPGGSSDPAQLLERMMQIARFSALEEMASAMAHTLNQPIGAVAAFAQAGERMLVRSAPMVDAAAEVFRNINEQALLAGDGIHQIRNLFRRQRTEHERCDPRALIDELLPVLQVLANRANTHLEVTFGAQLPAVNVDRLSIQHVIFTLVQNALEAPLGSQPQRKILISVDSDRYHLSISVVDNAAGVDARDAQDKLFRPYFTTKADGIGLGLASCRAIVEAHGGTIRYEPAAGGGSRFWFELPIADTTK